MRNNTPLANKETTSKRSSATFKDEESVSNSSDKKSRKGLAEDVRYDTKEEISLNRLINPIATEDPRYDDHASLSKHPSIREDDDDFAKRSFTGGIEDIKSALEPNGLITDRPNPNHSTKVIPFKSAPKSGLSLSNPGTNAFLSVIKKIKNEAPTVVVQEIDTVYLDRDQLERLKHIKYLIRGHSTIKLRLDIVIMILAIFNCFAIPFDVAFQPDFMDSWWILVLNSIIDFVFLFDLIINFRTSFIHGKTGKEIIEPREIALTYLKGRFWIDLMATIPFDTFAELIIGKGSSTFLSIFSLLKLVRVLRLNRIISIMKVANEVKLSLKLGKLVFFLTMYIHCLGCSWYYIASDNKKWIPPLDYVFVTTNFYNESLFFRYLSSLYHAMLLLGGNDLGPRGEVQLVFSTFALGMAAIINANIIGELAVILSKLNRKATNFQTKLDTANDAMRNLGLPEKLQVEITGFLTYSKSLLESQEELEEFLYMISPSSRQKVLKFMFTSALMTNPIFQKSQIVIDFVSARLDTRILLPEFIVVTQGEIGDCLFAIAKGECLVTVTDHRGKQHSVNRLEKGSVFGEVALLTGGKRTATVKTSQYSSIAKLKKEEFDTVCRVFAAFQPKLKEQLEKYNDPMKQFRLKLLKNVFWMEKVSPETLEEVAFFLDHQFLENDRILFRAGDYVDKIVFIASGEIEILVSLEDVDITMEVCDEGCSLGLNGILKNSFHHLTARTKSKTSIYTLNKDTLKQLLNTRDDLYNEVEKARKFYKESSLPIVDFSLPKYSLYREKKPSLIFRQAVKRMVRISKNLNKIVNAFEVVKLLQGLQGRYNRVSTQSATQDKINERMMELLEDLNHKINKMQGDVTNQGNLIRMQSIKKDGNTLRASRDSSRMISEADPNGMNKNNKLYLDEINEIMKEADTLNIDRIGNERNKRKRSKEERKGSQ